MYRTSLFKIVWAKAHWDTSLHFRKEPTRRDFFCPVTAAVLDQIFIVSTLIIWPYWGQISPKSWISKLSFFTRHSHDNMRCHSSAYTLFNMICFISLIMKSKILNACLSSAVKSPNSKHFNGLQIWMPVLESPVYFDNIAFSPSLPLTSCIPLSGLFFPLREMLKHGAE